MAADFKSAVPTNFITRVVGLPVSRTRHPEMMSIASLTTCELEAPVASCILAQQGKRLPDAEGR